MISHQIMNNLEKKQPESVQPLPGIPEETQSMGEKADENFNQNQKDLSEFNKHFIETKEKNREFTGKLAQWDNETDENIIKMRRAGFDKDTNNKDALEKHTLLSSVFLEMEKNKEKISYTVDFSSNKLAEKYIGMGDLLPPHVETVMVVDDEGNIVSKSATRAINQKHRIGYYDNETREYIPVHSGHRIVVLKTRTGSDPVLERRKLGENIALFQDKASNIEREDRHLGLDKTPPPTPVSMHQPITPSPESGVKKEPDKTITPGKKLSSTALKSQGYRPLKGRVPSKIVRQAIRCLKKGGPIGRTFVYEFDGKKYAFHREWHKHSASDRRPDGSRLSAGLYKKHHGITVYGQTA